MEHSCKLYATAYSTAAKIWAETEFKAMVLFQKLAWRLEFEV